MSTSKIFEHDVIVNGVYYRTGTPVPISEPEKKAESDSKDAPAKKTTKKETTSEK